MEINPIPIPTEWDEQQAKHGNLPDPWETYNLAKEEEAEEQKDVALDNATLSELSDLEDSEDEDILSQYRAKRLAEIQEAHSRAKFGSITEIRANEFIDQVTNVKDHYVVCFLYQDYVPVCKRVLIHLSSLARKFPEVKFVKIVGSECIQGYPDSNIPTVLIYYEGEKKHFVVGTGNYGGNQCNEDDIEYWLATLGIVQSEIEEDPRLKVDRAKTQSRFRMKNRHSIRQGEASSDDD
ncbi:hypothetical protein GEMRC1_001745 [Eukaryota sp. GEM-RC1]